MSFVVVEVDAETYKFLTQELRRLMQECSVGECHYQNEVREFYTKRKAVVERAFKQLGRVKQ